MPDTNPNEEKKNKNIGSFTLKVLTNKNLRQITLKLVKSLNPDNEVEWTLDFTLGEKADKKDKDFTEIVSLSVFINPDLNDKVEASRAGLNKQQTAETTTAGNFALLLKKKKIEKESFDDQSQQIFAVR